MNSPEIKRKMSRRDFIKLGGLLAASLGLNSASAPIKRIINFFENNPALNEKLKEWLDTVSIIDYFQGNTESIKAEIVDTAHSSFSALRELNLESSSFQDPLLQALNNYIKSTDSQNTTFLENEIIKIIVDQIIGIASSHGDMVSRALMTTTLRLLLLANDDVLNEGELENLNVGGFVENKGVAVHQAVRNPTFNANRPGTLEARFTIEPNEDLEPDTVSTVLCTAFQFGEVLGVLEIYKEMPYSYIIDNDTSEIFVFFNDLPPVDGRTFQLSYDNVNHVFTRAVLGSEVEPTQVTPDLIVPRPAVNNYEDIRNHIEDRIREFRLTEAYRRKLQELINIQGSEAWLDTRPLEERVAFFEPYGNPDLQKRQQAIAKYYEFCRENSDKFIVHAGGNNSNLSELETSDLPTNGLIISSMGGIPNWRSQKFGTPHEQRIGCIGAEVYVDANDFNKRYDIFSTSEATGIISAYINLINAAGISVENLKEWFITNCCVSVEDEIQIGVNRYISGTMFNREKADAAVKTLLQTQLRPSN